VRNCFRRRKREKAKRMNKRKSGVSTEKSLVSKVHNLSDREIEEISLNESISRREE